VHYAAAPRLVIAIFAAALGCLAACAAEDTPGRLLLVIVALVLLAEAIRLAAVRPVLRADHGGLVLRSGWRERRWQWAQLAAVRAARTTRLVRLATLEIDLGEELVVIAGYRLGSDPAAIAAALENMWAVHS
jgi:hypothetical protein